MALPITFSPREQRHLTKEWQKHYDKLRQSFEPTYYVERQYSTAGIDGRPLLLTAWSHGRPVIMPPADLVSVMVFDSSTYSVRSYVISQPALLDQLGGHMQVETFPTRYFQIEAMNDTIYERLLGIAELAGERHIELATA